VVLCSVLWACGESEESGVKKPVADAGTDSDGDAAIEADTSTPDGASEGAADTSDADAESAPLVCEEGYEWPDPRPEPGITKVDLHTFGFEQDFEGAELLLDGPDVVRMRPSNVGCRFVITPGTYTLFAKVTDLVFPPVQVEIPADPLVTLVAYRQDDAAYAVTYSPDLTPPGPGNWRITFFNVTQDNLTNPVDIFYYPSAPPEPPIVEDAVPLALALAQNTAVSVVVPENTYYLDVEPTGQLTPDLWTSIVNCGVDPGLDCVWSYTLVCDSAEVGDGGYCDNKLGGPGSGFSLTPPAD
jgi:hypothetical protein